MVTYLTSNRFVVAFVYCVLEKYRNTLKYRANKLIWKMNNLRNTLCISRVNSKCIRKIESLETAQKSKLVSCTSLLFLISVLSRLFSGTPVLETKQYRLERGLSVHKNAEGVLTDGPDYTFLDGRPTPLLVSNAAQNRF